MTTIVEKNSSPFTVLLTFVVIILLIGGGGLGFGYRNGTFGGKTTVIENNKTVENKTTILPVQTPPPAREVVPESRRPEQQPAR
jgi:uncharacterized membrane protein